MMSMTPKSYLGPDLLGMPVMENSSLIFSSCHLELVILENWEIYTMFWNNKLVTGIDDQGLTHGFEIIGDDSVCHLWPSNNIPSLYYTKGFFN